MSEADDIAMLNIAPSLEHQAIAACQVGAESGLLQKPIRIWRSGSRGTTRPMPKSSQQASARRPKRWTWKPADDTFPLARLKTQADVLRFASGLELGAASACPGAAPQFANRDLAKAASILGDHTMHWTVQLNALGENPAPAAFIG